MQKSNYNKQIIKSKLNESMKINVHIISFEAQMLALSDIITSYDKNLCIKKNKYIYIYTHSHNLRTKGWSLF